MSRIPGVQAWLGQAMAHPEQDPLGALIRCGPPRRRCCRLVVAPSAEGHDLDSTQRKIARQEDEFVLDDSCTYNLPGILTQYPIAQCEGRRGRQGSAMWARFRTRGSGVLWQGFDKSLGQTHRSDWLWLGRLDAESESDWTPSQAGPSVQAQVSPALPLIRLRWETLPAGSDEIPD